MGSGSALEVPPGTTPPGDVAAPKASFVGMLDGWSDSELGTETVFVVPNRPWTWRRDDPGIAASCNEQDAIDDLRVVAAARQRGLDGDSALLRACVRAIRGLARSLDPAAGQGGPDPMPPKVAAAMLNAGLAAFGEEAIDVPAPATKMIESDFEPPATPPAPSARRVRTRGHHR